MFCNVLYGNQDYTNVPQCLCLRQLLHRQHVADMDGVDPEFVCLVKQSNVFVLYSAILFSIPTGMFLSQYACVTPQAAPPGFFAVPGQQWSQALGAVLGKEGSGR